MQRFYVFAIGLLELSPSGQQRRVLLDPARRHRNSIGRCSRWIVKGQASARVRLRRASLSARMLRGAVLSV